VKPTIITTPNAHLNALFMAFPPVLTWRGGNGGRKLERHKNVF
jgi:hypothetical protein